MDDKILSTLHDAVAEELLRRVISGDASSADLNRNYGTSETSCISLGSI